MKRRSERRSSSRPSDAAHEAAAKTYSVLAIKGAKDATTDLSKGLCGTGVLRLFNAYRDLGLASAEQKWSPGATKHMQRAARAVNHAHAKFKSVCMVPARKTR
jgi:hypothetical protein